MTENEIRKYIEELREKARLFSKSGYATAGMEKAFNKSADTIENLLNELEAYRAIGTVEEIIHSNAKALVEQVELEKYKSIGTIDEFKALKEKSVAKKPNKDEFDRFTCPDCGWIVSTEEYGGRFLPHCENCGQAIDWSE